MRIAVLPLCLVLLAAPAAPQDPHPRPGGDGSGARTEAELREARERWEALTEDERAELRRRYETFRQFDEERRRELRERARRLRDIGEHLREHELTPELERELDALPPEQRRARLRKWLRERFEERGRRIRAKLPPEQVERLERSPPGRRGALAEGLRREWRAEHAEHLIEKLARRGRLAPARVEELRALPVDERIDALLELRREAIRADVARRGLPSGVAPAEWARWQALSTREFFEHFHRAVGHRHHRGRPHGPASADPRRAAWREVRELLGPRGSRARRGAGDRPALDAGARARLLELLGGLGVEPGRVEALRALEGRELEQAVRDLLRERIERTRPSARGEGVERPQGPRERRGRDGSGRRR